MLDRYARKVVGWSMKLTLAKELVLDALLTAVWRRKPQGEVIALSNQGSQYGREEWRRNGYDNAVAESFLSSLRKERVRKKIYETRADIFDYIEVFYNGTRHHSHLGGLSPEAFERASCKTM